MLTAATRASKTEPTHTDRVDFPFSLAKGECNPLTRTSMNNVKTACCTCMPLHTEVGLSHDNSGGSIISKPINR